MAKESFSGCDPSPDDHGEDSGLQNRPLIEPLPRRRGVLPTIYEEYLFEVEMQAALEAINRTRPRYEVGVRTPTLLWSRISDEERISKTGGLARALRYALGSYVETDETDPDRPLILKRIESLLWQWTDWTGTEFTL